MTSEACGYVAFGAFLGTIATVMYFKGAFKWAFYGMIDFLLGRRNK